MEEKGKRLPQVVATLAGNKKTIAFKNISIAVGKIMIKHGKNYDSFGQQTHKKVSGILKKTSFLLAVTNFC